MRQVSIQAHTKLMQFAFNQICDPDDWRGPIDCIVPWDTANVYMQAIEFMTATRPTYQMQPDGKTCRLVATGYRNGPAGA